MESESLVTLGAELQSLEEARVTMAHWHDFCPAISIVANPEGWFCQVRERFAAGYSEKTVVRAGYIPPFARCREGWGTQASVAACGYGDPFRLTLALLSRNVCHGSDAGSAGQLIVDIGANLRRVGVPLGLPVAVYLPIGACEAVIVGSAPLENCVVCSAEAAVRSEVRCRCYRTGGRCRADYPRRAR